MRFSLGSHMRSHPRRALPGSLPHLGFMLSSCSWAERCTVSETTRRLQAVRPPGPQREETVLRRRDQRTPCSTPQSSSPKRFCRPLKCHPGIWVPPSDEHELPVKRQLDRASGHEGQRLGCGAGAILSTSSPRRRLSGRMPGRRPWEGGRRTPKCSEAFARKLPPNNSPLGPALLMCHPNRASLIQTPPIQIM